MRFNFLLAFILFLSIHTFAQPEAKNDTVRPWWEYGVQFGAFLADNSSANFYNGEGINDITRITDNEDYRERIRQSIPYEQFQIGTMPQNMAYNATSMPGIHLEYHRDSSISFFINFQYVQLKANDNFKVIDPIDDFGFEKYILSNIRATEERVMIDIGTKKSWPATGHFSYYIIGGVSINNTTVESHKIDIGTFTQSIKSNYSEEEENPYYPGNNYDFKQGGIGLGFVGGMGIKLTYQQNLYAALDFTSYYSQTILPGRKQFGIHFAPMLRLGYKASSLFPSSN